VAVKIRKYAGDCSQKSKKVSVKLIGGQRHYCSKSFGFLLNDNCLEKGIGGELDDKYTTIPADVKSGYYSSANGALFAASDEGVYLYYPKLKKYFASIYSQPEKTPYFFDVYNGGMDSTIIAIGGTALGFTGYGVSTLKDTKEFYCGTMHCGRFFGRDKSNQFRIWWSATGGFQDWTEGIDGYGYMVLSYEGGGVVKLMNYNERLLAIKKRGITIIKAYGEPQHYVASDSATYLTADDIIAETCAYCGGNLMFCTTSGIFSFDGSDIERQDTGDCYDLYDFKSAVGLGDKYYVICSSKKLGEGLVYVYETSAKKGYFIDLKPTALVAAESVTAFSNDGIYTLSQQSGKGYWTSCGIDFGEAQLKCLKDVDINCDGDITLKVTADGVSRTFSGSGKKRVDMSGRQFYFEISGTGNVYGVDATAEVRE
jgi:hypothetical protein